MEIIPLSEGSFIVDVSKRFVPYNSGSNEPEPRIRGGMMVEVQPFVVITDRDIILLDSGLGLNGGSGQIPLIKNLRDAGVEPEAVTKVLMSHLHKDHSGGMINPYTHTPQFENAVYYLQRRELMYAHEKGAPSYNLQDFENIESTANLVLLEEDEGVIDGYIHYQVTAAHSKFHQVFWIASENETIFFGADDAPKKDQMKRRFVAKYDFDGPKAMSLREKWRKEGKTGHWTFLFYHDTETPVLKVS